MKSRRFAFCIASLGLAASYFPTQTSLKICALRSLENGLFRYHQIDDVIDHSFDAG